MFSKVTFGIALLLTIFIIGNLGLWILLQESYNDEFTFSEINSFYFRLFPDFLKYKGLSKLNIYLSIASFFLFGLSIFTQTKPNVLRSISSIILQIVDILVITLMLLWLFF